MNQGVWLLETLDSGKKYNKTLIWDTENYSYHILGLVVIKPIDFFRFFFYFPYK